MAAVVGLPRGLLYYYYGAIWERFFTCLGAEVLVSGETTKATLDRGDILDEVCLPLKIFCGHVAEIKHQVDYLFVPRIVSLGKNEYNCPKIIGLPDLLRSAFDQLPPLIDVHVSVRQSRSDEWKAAAGSGQALGAGRLRSLYAWQKARRDAVLNPVSPGNHAACVRVALIGHPYILHDRQASLRVIDRLRSLGVAVITADMVPKKTAEQAAAILPKSLYWTYCRHLVGSALALMDAPQAIDGLLFMTSFSCGPDSLIAEIVKQHAKKRELPFMILSIDEHTAEAGMVTRLEAFTDMLARLVHR
ncbi:MAG: acyl-CoA dehydratase activase-related protein [Negativicutes bacterium]|nr:acyl-CoA dehydratase activase-related protein [Negativicutes bacterium]